MDKKNPETTTIGVGECIGNFFAYHWRGVFSIVIPLILSPILILKFDSKADRCMFLVCLMALYWVTEVVPLYITSLLPIVFFPLFGILSSAEVCKQYFGDTVVTFITGLIVALSIEYCNLHKRVALKVILVIGCSPRRLMIGITYVSMFISFWITNSATAAMMCPIVKAVLDELDTQKVIEVYKKKDNERLLLDDKPLPTNIAMSYYLCVTYAATLGGCATLIGTGTNLTLKGIYEGRFPTSTDNISFVIFMGYNVPWVLVATTILLVTMMFTHLGMFRPKSKAAKEIKEGLQAKDRLKEVIRTSYVDLGPMSMHEIQVGLLFIVMVVLLLVRSPGFMPGWADFFNAKSIKIALAVTFTVVLLYMMPIHYLSWRYCGTKGPYTRGETPSLLPWKYIQSNVPWGLLFLLGGGFALSEGSNKSGMAKMVGDSLVGMKVLPVPAIMVCSLVVSVFMTAFSANVAIANIVLPVLCELAVTIKVHPLYFVLPAGLGCSIAFHLPVSTPGNAIVAGYANIQTKYMAVSGILPTIFTILVMVVNGLTIHNVFYPPFWDYPAWADENAPVIED